VIVNLESLAISGTAVVVTAWLTGKVVKEVGIAWLYRTVWLILA
jgi:hypothetical protein